MATITLTIPDALVPDLAASVRNSYGDAVGGDAVSALSDVEACKHAARAHLKHLYRAHRKRTSANASVEAADSALTAKAAAAAAAVQARKDAEDAALAQAEADFAGVA